MEHIKLLYSRSNSHKLETDPTFAIHTYTQAISHSWVTNENDTITKWRTFTYSMEYSHTTLV